VRLTPLTVLMAFLARPRPSPPLDRTNLLSPTSASHRASGCADDAPRGGARRVTRPLTTNAFMAKIDSRAKALWC
jgi:hypothetical protein